MNDNAGLRKKASELLRQGRVPTGRPEKIWAGPAAGHERCVVCDQVFPPGQVVYEAEFAGPAGATCHHFHVVCYRALLLQWSEVQDGPGVQTDPERRQA